MSPVHSLFSILSGPSTPLLTHLHQQGQILESGLTDTEDTLNNNQFAFGLLNPFRDGLQTDAILSIQSLKG